MGLRLRLREDGREVGEIDEAHLLRPFRGREGAEAAFPDHWILLRGRIVLRRHSRVAPEDPALEPIPVQMGIIDGNQRADIEQLGRRDPLFPQGYDRLRRHPGSP